VGIIVLATMRKWCEMNVIAVTISELTFALNNQSIRFEEIAYISGNAT